MWANYMQFLTDDAVTVQELIRLARTKTNVAGMQRRGYIVVETSGDEGARRLPRSHWLVQATNKGRTATAVWQPLFALIEGGWEDRFGEPAIRNLRHALGGLTDQLAIELPECLPILGYGLWSRLTGEGQPPELWLANTTTSDPGPSAYSASSTSMFTLLSRALLAFALEFERRSDLSLAICSNVLRVISERTARVRDLPRITGVSKESISMALEILKKGGWVDTGRDEAPRSAPTVALTRLGKQARSRYLGNLKAVESDWELRLGPERIGDLREALDTVVGDGTADGSWLFEGLQPYPDGWQASVRQSATLPHFPMVRHRGGFPDGS